MALVKCLVLTEFSRHYERRQKVGAGMGVEVGSATGRSKKLFVLGARSGSGQNTETQTLAYQAREIILGLFAPAWLLEEACVPGNKD